MEELYGNQKLFDIYMQNTAIPRLDKLKERFEDDKIGKREYETRLFWSYCDAQRNFPDLIMPVSLDELIEVGETHWNFGA